MSPALTPVIPVDDLRIIRAVASSTAIETGQSIQDIESRLLSPDNRFHGLDLAVLTTFKS